MTPEKLRANLLALRERLSTQRDSIHRGGLNSESGRYTSRTSINMAEHASDEQELDMMASRITASSETLGEIKDALEHLDAGHFNVCEECGKEIGLRRLEIQPWARLCVECKRRIEEENA